MIGWRWLASGVIFLGVLSSAAATDTAPEIESVCLGPHHPRCFRLSVKKSAVFLDSEGKPSKRRELKGAESADFRNLTAEVAGLAHRIAQDSLRSSLHRSPCDATLSIRIQGGRAVLLCRELLADTESALVTRFAGHFKF